jgi:hypothetical protein
MDSGSGGQHVFPSPFVFATACPSPSPHSRQAFSLHYLAHTCQVLMPSPARGQKRKPLSSNTRAQSNVSVSRVAQAMNITASRQRDGRRAVLSNCRRIADVPQSAPAPGDKDDTATATTPVPGPSTHPEVAHLQDSDKLQEKADAARPMYEDVDRENPRVSQNGYSLGHLAHLFLQSIWSVEEHLDQYAEEIMRLYAFFPEGLKLCKMCLTATASIKCIECHQPAGFCRPCVLKAHALLPLHRVEVSL